MKKDLFLILAFAFGMVTFASAQCETSKARTVAHVVNEKDVVDIAIGSSDHTTLVAAVKAAGLVETLKSSGPFTIFAPTNAAFDKLPAGTVASLLKPEMKNALTSILTYHVVAGNLDSKAVVGAIKAGNGIAEVTTVQGGKLKAMIDGENVVLMDENGNKSTVTAVDLKGSNGVIHVIDTVVTPKSGK